MDSNYRIKKCFICLGPAKVWSGHFLLGPLEVTAGTCEKHRDETTKIPFFMNSQGCLGAWHPNYGLEVDDEEQ